MDGRHVALAAFVALSHLALWSLRIDSGPGFDAWGNVATALLQVSACVATINAVGTGPKTWFVPAILGLGAAVILAYANRMLPTELRMPRDALAYWCASMPATTLATRLLCTWTGLDRPKRNEDRKGTGT